ncbi:MAG: hypothetical protein ACRC7C_08360, partial [Beijerinckiaceae bacterium]
RLAVTPEKVLLADFKTGNPPADLQAVPSAHLRQLAVYRALLIDLYGDRPVLAAVIWTQSATIVRLDPARLDAALEA